MHLEIYLVMSCLLFANMHHQVEGGAFLDTLLSANITITEELPVQCPNGFIRFEDRCYNFISQTLSWIEAFIYCRLFDQNLAQLYSEEQYNFMKFHLKSISGSENMHQSSGFWLGATDSSSPGKWIWIKDKSAVNFSRWGGSQPSSARPGCLALWKSLGFAVHAPSCGQTMHPICEIKTSKLA